MNAHNQPCSVCGWIENYKLTAKTVYLFLKNASIQNLCTKKWQLGHRQHLTSKKYSSKWLPYLSEYSNAYTPPLHLFWSSNKAACLPRKENNKMNFFMYRKKHYLLLNKILNYEFLLSYSIRSKSSATNMSRM
jgi:hypothetical protein